ncbi:MAG TPA: hypothetical protein VFQ78_13120 [Candidatus Udaeobacter sp.]|nr:hypothetical protein [Candidatus Udaeobacter sp.]
MKPLSILIAVAFASFAIGCTDPLEQRTGQEMQSQFQRGITGQGQLGPEPRDAGDPAAEHGVPQTHP